jgi:GR25 family glycosyltransferase involved in LPS biosynthesis
MLHCDELDPFLQTDRICLSLPEYQVRFNYINHLIETTELKELKFSVVIGLRHVIGWVGCGLSYKYLFYKALQRNLTKITISEDDIILEDNFNDNFQAIISYLKVVGSWDVFNGYTFWHGNRDLECIFALNTRYKLFKTSSLISTVFNIYNISAIESGAKWDATLRNQENAIDGYLKGCISSVIVSYPFIVDHNDNLDSVLWGESNEFIYAHMVAESKQVIKDAIKS